MLVLNVGPIFVARGIDRPSTFLIKSGLSPHSANFILYGKTRSIRLDHIEKLCKLLICEPSDLFVWYPDKNEALADTHPINKLKRKVAAESIQHLIADIPFKEIAEIAEALKEEKEKRNTLKTEKEA